MKVFELKEKSKEELVELLNGFNRELLNLRLRRASHELPNPLRLRTLRRDIARIKTLLREGELHIRKLIEVRKPVQKTKTKKGEKNA